MADEDHIDLAETRARQSSPGVIGENYALLRRFGVYNLLKVVNPPSMLNGKVIEQERKVSGYLTLLPAISGRTPKEMRVILGLRDFDLMHGALIYRLRRMPEMEDIDVRGYTTLVDGAALKPGITQDSAGYHPGQGAYQISLRREIEAELIAQLGPNSPFNPGVHPDVGKLYPPGHPARG